jgi:hypothetical protein
MTWWVAPPTLLLLIYPVSFWTLMGWPMELLAIFCFPADIWRCERLPAAFGAVLLI